MLVSELAANAAPLEADACRSGRILNDAGYRPAVTSGILSRADDQRLCQAYR